MVAPENGATDAGFPQGSDPADTRSTDQERTPAAAPRPGDQPAGPTEHERIAELEIQLAERTDDLQRIHAEYVNYKRRVDRDRSLARAGGIETVLSEMLPILDDLGTARQHEELSGGFKLLADELEKLAAKYGLVGFGEKGDPFDPHLHDALMQANQPGVREPTCIEILQRGYKLKERILRPARVAVAIPTDEPPAAGATPPAAERPIAGQDTPEPPQGAGSAGSGPAN